ncbi:hypothetical protein GPALN_014701 [Globodera pallida]|nr:hypothetical protein GPALN_014701 [Globodera pallida]
MAPQQLDRLSINLHHPSIYFAPRFIRMSAAVNNYTCQPLFFNSLRLQRERWDGKRTNEGRARLTDDILYCLFLPHSTRPMHLRSSSSISSSSPSPFFLFCPTQFSTRWVGIAPKANYSIRAPPALCPLRTAPPPPPPPPAAAAAAAHYPFPFPKCGQNLWGG